MGAALFIGLDSSTQSTKAIAWDETGRSVSEGRSPVPLSNPQLGHFEQDPEDWWRSSCEALRGCMAGIGDGEVRGLAVSNQRETVAFFDRSGESVRPAMVWLDERSRREVGTVSEALGAERIHAITGRPADLTPCLYRLAWMQAHEPELYDRTAMFADVQATLVQRLTGGPFRNSFSSACPFGLFDLQAKEWSEPILQLLELDRSRLPDVQPPGTELGTVGRAAAEATGLPGGTPVFAGGGDGQLAGLGTNCTMPERAYINLGTAVVSGVWSPTFLHSLAWRTEVAGQGTGYILENCLRSGAFLINWFVDSFVPGGRGDAAVYERLEEEAAALPIGSEGVMVQPYWSGVMDPHWDVDARGVILGLSASHGPAHVYRAILEGITLDQVMRTRAMEAAMGTGVGTGVEHFVAIGGGAASPLWRQMLADASGKEVRLSTTVEASALGAGMLAAAGSGAFGTIEEAAAAMCGETRPVLPNGADGSRYGELLGIYQDVYASTASINARLVEFAAGGAR